MHIKNGNNSRIVIQKQQKLKFCDLKCREINEPRLYYVLVYYYYCYLIIRKKTY